MTSPPFAPDPIADLWREAHAWFTDMLRTFGAPARFATLTREACAALKRELRALESLVLKLLLVEAAQLASHPFPDARAASIPGPMNTAGAQRRAALAAPRSPAAVFMGPGLAASPRPGNGWRSKSASASFSLRLPRETAARRCARSQTTRPARDIDPRQLARRCEALRRVLANPAHFAARLARRLCALGARACAAARRIALARPREVPRHPMLHARACIAACDIAGDFRGAG